MKRNSNNRKPKERFAKKDNLRLLRNKAANAPSDYVVLNSLDKVSMKLLQKLFGHYRVSPLIKF